MRLSGWGITKVRGGFSIHTNDQIIEEILELLSLQQARGVWRPSERIKTRQTEPELLHGANRRIYRQAVGKLLFLSHFRADIQYAVGRCSRKVQAPSVDDWAAVKKIGRYLRNTRHREMLLVPKKGPWRLCAESDADWAGSIRRDAWCS